MSSARRSRTSACHSIEETAVTGYDDRLGELGFVGPAARFTESRTQRGIRANALDRIGERLRAAAASSRERHQDTAFAILDQTGRPIARRGDNGQSGGPGLDHDIAERLVE